jgi:hypothetical protein
MPNPVERRFDRLLKAMTQGDRPSRPPKAEKPGSAKPTPPDPS